MIYPQLLYINNIFCVNIVFIVCCLNHSMRLTLFNTDEFYETNAYFNVMEMDGLNSECFFSTDHTACLHGE